MRLVARGFEQTVSSDADFFAGTPKLTILRAILTMAAIHGNPVAFGDCHSAFHESPTPSDADPVYVEPAPETQLDTSKVWLCKNAFRGLIISPQAWGIHSTQKIIDMNYRHLVFDTSTYVKKGAQRSEDSILLRHMDDVVGTGPAEHLRDSEHIKTSLYLTDVVVLRQEGDTVNFSGLEVAKTSTGVEGKHYRSRRIPFESLRIRKFETDSQSRQAIDNDGAHVSNSFGWSRLLQLSHSHRKAHLHRTLETRHAIRHPTTIHTSPPIHDREQARSKAVDTTSQRRATHLSSS